MMLTVCMAWFQNCSKPEVYPSEVIGYKQPYYQHGLGVAWRQKLTNGGALLFIAQFCFKAAQDQMKHGIDPLKARAGSRCPCKPLSPAYMPLKKRNRGANRWTQCPYSCILPDWHPVQGPGPAASASTHMVVAFRQNLFRNTSTQGWYNLADLTSW